MNVPAELFLILLVVARLLWWRQVEQPKGDGVRTPEGKPICSPDCHRNFLG